MNSTDEITQEQAEQMLFDIYTARVAACLRACRGIPNSTLEMASSDDPEQNIRTICMIHNWTSKDPFDD